MFFFSRDVAEFFYVLGHSSEGKDDLSETKSQAAVAVHVKGSQECRVVDVPELVCDGGEEREYLEIQQFTELGIFTLSKQGEKVIVV